MKHKYVCIHGHFYQPPRENAWLEVVELQDSAHPFHDWNDRINFECYAPNTAARILGENDKITGIINNYARISFNFGPTLLSWMEKNDIHTYISILEADKKSLDRFHGHGSAIAQVYSHLIMPLANRRDKETQVRWGIADFIYRFGRRPEGMWLAETAADTETLEVLAEQGIRYTILAPRQAKAVRRIGEESWSELAPDSVDPRRPYRCVLPSGKEISLFFYHGQIAQSVAFEGLLNNGHRFARAFLDVFDDDEQPQLAHIATDGESYGHHHRHGEMALAACLQHIEQDPTVILTNYGQYLDLFPPEYEVQIHENSSWSCVHGVERWRSNCGCNTGSPTAGTQAWREPLRQALDWLRDQLLPLYVRQAEQYLHQIWDARNDYIHLILRRTDKQCDLFFSKYAIRPLTDSEKTTVLRLMEMQRHALLMFTSCGWFFDEISGIETDQILQYAQRAIEYASKAGGPDHTAAFEKLLAKAPSNVYANGAGSYRRNVVPSRVDLTSMAMHYAVSSLFEEYPESVELFNYRASGEVLHHYQAGLQKLVIGRTRFQSRTTLSKQRFSFAVLYLGQQNLIGNISIEMPRDTFDQMAEQITEAFKSTDLGKVIGLMQEYFGLEKFSIQQLFRDEKRKILHQITEKNLGLIQRDFREIYNDNYQLMTGIQQSDIPLPEAYLTAVKVILNHDLKAFFQEEELRVKQLLRLSAEFEKWNIPIAHRSELNLAGGERIYKELQRILAEGLLDHDERLTALDQVIEILQSMGVEIDLWKSQNIYYSMLKAYRRIREEKPYPQWEECFLRLGAKLGMQT